MLQPMAMDAKEPTFAMGDLLLLTWLVALDRSTTTSSSSSPRSPTRPSTRSGNGG